jgi:hypothetical protein
MIEYGVLLEHEIPLLLELYKQLTPLNDEIINECTAKKIWKEIEKYNITYLTQKQDFEYKSKVSETRP